MAIRHLIRKPHHINYGAWWYEENGGIFVVQEARNADGVHLKTMTSKIPWRSIRAALARKDKK